MKIKKYKNITIVIFIFLLIIITYYFSNKYFKSNKIQYFSNENVDQTKEKYIINLVTFYSEGPPNDNGLNLSINKDNILKQNDHFDNISIYTPKRLKNIGLGKYVKEYNNSGLVTMNKGMSKIGFCAWRPKILLLELEKMNDGEIIIYRDINIKKYPVLGNYNNIRNIALRILDIVEFDFFVPRENHKLQLKQLTKTNIIRELGDNHPFTYNFPNMICNFLIVRKSKVSIQLLKEWENACLKEEWINGEKYGELHPDFMWSCPEQSILGVIIANWVRKKKHNIPKNYPMIGFKGRNIDNMFFYDTNSDYDYLLDIDK